MATEQDVGVARADGTTRRLLLFTDLDGTLLDDHYRFDAAADALDALRRRRVPLILSSSKTLSELRLLRRALGSTHPVIFENGCGVAVPAGYFLRAPGEEAVDGELEVELFGPPYAELREQIARLRSRHGFAFRGFGDMSTREVAQRTGLDDLSAQRARDRRASEPGIWEGNEAERSDFVAELEALGLRAVMGGRFLHVMPRVDKATAMHYLVDRFREQAPRDAFTVVAAGDSPNDADMLAAADIAIIVRRADGTWMPMRRKSGVIRAPEAGPAGWQIAVRQVLAAADEDIDD